MTYATVGPHRGNYGKYWSVTRNGTLLVPVNGEQEASFLVRYLNDLEDGTITPTPLHATQPWIPLDHLALLDAWLYGRISYFR